MINLFVLQRFIQMVWYNCACAHVSNTKSILIFNETIGDYKDSADLNLVECLIVICIHFGACADHIKVKVWCCGDVAAELIN